MAVMRDPRLNDYWQYKVRIYHMNHFSGAKAIETEQDLNELGSERWECYHITNDGEFLIYNFKRLMVRL